MLKASSIFPVFLLTLSLSIARGEEYSVEAISAAPDADEVSAELAQQMSPDSIKVKRGSTRTMCQIWLCKHLDVKANWKITEEELYPFTPGQLIGLLHFPRRGKDFRDQTVSSGWYTLRFGLQPVDGNHVGTSPTRDFLMLIDASQDAPNKQWTVRDLSKQSAEAAGSNHPALLCLRKVETAGSQLSIRHDEPNDLWIVHVVGKHVVKDKALDIPLALVVAGHAAE